MSEQCATDRHPLALAAGKGGWPTVEQVGDAQGLDHGREGEWARLWGAAPAIEKVVLHAAVWE